MSTFIEKKTGQGIAIAALALGAGFVAFECGGERSQSAGSAPRAVHARPSQRERTDQALEKDWRSRIREIIATADEAERDAALNVWLSEKPPHELTEIVLFLWGQIPGEASRETARKILRQLAEQHPDQAAELAGKLPSGSAREAVMLDVAVVWAARDFSSAVDWIKQWPEGESRERGLIGAGYEAARTDAWAALDLAANLPASETRDGLIRHVAAQCSVDDPEAVAAWAKQLSDPPLRDRTIGAVATEWSDRDPVAAAAFAIEQLPPGRVLDDTLVAIVQRWVQVEPDAARSWVQQFPAGPLRSSALEQIALLHPTPGF